MPFWVFKSGLKQILRRSDAVSDVQKVAAELYSNLGLKALNLTAADPKTFTQAYDEAQPVEAPLHMSDSPSRQEIDAKIAASAAGTRSEFEALRGDMAEARASMKTDLSEMRAEVRTGFAEMKAELKAIALTAQKENHEMNANMSRWMLGTTLTIVSTVVLGFAGLFFNITKSLSDLKPAPAPAAQIAPAAAAVPAPKTP